MFATGWVLLLVLVGVCALFPKTLPERLIGAIVVVSGLLMLGSLVSVARRYLP